MLSLIHYLVSENTMNCTLVEYLYTLALMLYLLRKCLILQQNTSGMIFTDVHTLSVGKLRHDGLGLIT